MECTHLLPSIYCTFLLCLSPMELLVQWTCAISGRQMINLKTPGKAGEAINFKTSITFDFHFLLSFSHTKMFDLSVICPKWVGYPIVQCYRAPKLFRFVKDGFLRVFCQIGGNWMCFPVFLYFVFLVLGSCFVFFVVFPGFPRDSLGFPGFPRDFPGFSAHRDHSAKLASIRCANYLKYIHSSLSI